MSSQNGFISPLEQKQNNIKKGKLDGIIRKSRKKIGYKRLNALNLLSKTYENTCNNNNISGMNNNNNMNTNDTVNQSTNAERVNDDEDLGDSNNIIKNPINKLKIKLQASRIMKGHGNKVYALSWNKIRPNEIVSASRDARLIFWNVDTGYKRLAYNLETEFIMTVKYSPNAKFVACGGLDDEISIFKINPNAIGVADDVKPSQVLRGHTGYISCVEYVNDNVILSASGDQTIRLWDIDKQREISKYNIHNGDVMSININGKNPNIFASGSTDSTCKISDIRENTNIKCTNIFNMEKLTDINCVKWFKDNESIAAGCDDGIVRLFDQRTNYCLQNYNIEKYYNPDKYAKELKEYMNKYNNDDSKEDSKDDDFDSNTNTIENNNNTNNINNSNNINKTNNNITVDANVSPIDNNNKSKVPSTTVSQDNEQKQDNKQNNNDDESETDYDAYADEYEEDKFFASYQTNNRGNDGVAKLDFSLSGGFMFVSYNNGKKNSVIIWNTITGDIVGELEHEHHVPCLAVSYEGNKLVTGCWDHYIRLWSPK